MSEGPYRRAELENRGPELYRTGQAQSTVLQETDLERGVSYVRQMDPGFDEGRFRDTCADLFFRVQAAWGHRELEPLRAILTPEMYIQLSEDVERYKKERRINRLENIAVRSVEVTEAWQEQGQDYVLFASSRIFSITQWRRVRATLSREAGSSRSSLRSFGLSPTR